MLNGGSVTINDVANVALGAVADGGSATTINKLGAGRLIFDASPIGGAGNSSSLVAGTNINIQAGTVVISPSVGGPDPIGAASITLNGGALLLDSQGAAEVNGAVPGTIVTNFNNAPYPKTENGLLRRCSPIPRPSRWWRCSAVRPMRRN